MPLAGLPHRIINRLTDSTANWEWLKTHGLSDEDTISPGGPAGGDLAGTYPDPTIATGAVGSDEIAANAVGADELAANSVLPDDAATCAAPSQTINAGDSASEGSGTAFLRNDAQFAVSTAAASSISNSNTEGSSTSLARADHNHAYANTSIPTAALVANAVTSVHTATGSTSGPTTTSTADPLTAVVPQMVISADFDGDPILVCFTGVFQNSAAGNITRCELFEGISGSEAAVAGTRRQFHAPVAAYQEVVSIIWAFTTTDGTRDYEIRWGCTAGTTTAASTLRQLIIIRLKK